MVTVSGSPNPTNPTTKYRCELDMCCLTWYKNLGPPFTGLPKCLFLLYRTLLCIYVGYHIRPTTNNTKSQ